MDTFPDNLFPAVFGKVPRAVVDDPAGGKSLSAERKAELMDRIYARGDWLVTRFILAHAFFALALATFYQTWLVTGVTTFSAVAMFAVAARLMPRSFLTRCLAGISLQVFVALHIYQLHGLAEMHFFFFTAFTVLIVYQDWKCMWPGAIGLIGQHLGFALLHNAGLGAGIYFFEAGYVGFTKLFFHFSIALGQVAICGYWAYLLQQQTLASAAQNAGLRTLSEQLHQSEGKFRGLIAHALDIITVVEADGTIRYESPAVERVLGYAPEELLGRNVFEFVHPEDQPMVTAAFVRRQNAPGEGSVPVEFRYRHRDGSWRTVEAVGSIMDAAVGGMVINSRDVTERCRAEREAKRRANQQNATSELARQALAGITLAELFEATVKLVARTLEVEFSYLGVVAPDGENIQVRAEFGYPSSPEQFKSIPAGPRSQGGYTLMVKEPVVVEDMATETRFQPTVLAKRDRVRSGLSVVVGHQDRAFGVLVTQSTEPHRFTQDDTAFLNVMADILSSALERKQAEEAMLAAKEEAERANAAKSEFLSRMSHELRTPLNAILGFGQLLEMGERSRSETESVGHIMRAGRHLLALIDEVLAISRIEAGRMDLSLEPVALAEVVQECMGLVSRQAEARGVRCENRCSPKEIASLHVQADRQRLRQVLLNLLSNAVKYNHERGQVVVSCHVLPALPMEAPDGKDGRSQENRPARRLRLEVSDTGRGLSGEEIRQLFVPFERLGAERTATEGTGLGLALSKGLTSAMGGAIGVESVPGEGSTFWVELPVVSDPRSEMEAGLKSPVLRLSDHRYQGTLLYIEDNLSNLRLLEMLLETRPGFELLSAQQGTLGLAMARERRPDLILLDLHLPDLPGWEVLAQLQADERTREIPVVIISADATPGQVARLLAAGARQYLTKPIDVAKLILALDEHLPLQAEMLPASA